MKEWYQLKSKTESIQYVRNYMPPRNLLFFTGLIMYFSFITFLFDIFQLFEKLILQAKKCLTGRNTHQAFAEKNNQVREKVIKEKPFFILSLICAVLKWTKEWATGITCKDLNTDHQHWVYRHTIGFRNRKPNLVTGILHLFPNMVSGYQYGDCSCNSNRLSLSLTRSLAGVFNRIFTACT